MMIVEQSVKWELAGETEVLAESLLQCHFVHHKSHMIWPRLESGPPRWGAGGWSMARPSRISYDHFSSIFSISRLIDKYSIWRVQRHYVSHKSINQYFMSCRYQQCDNLPHVSPATVHRFSATHGSHDRSLEFVQKISSTKGRFECRR
jgi:hypothetical protein